MKTTVQDIKDLNLGDVVEIDNDCYSHCTGSADPSSKGT